MVNVCVWMMFVLDFTTYDRRLHDGDIDALRLSKKLYPICTVIVCTYMLLFLVPSSSLSLTTHRYIQRGLYNQGKNRTVDSIQCSYFLSYSIYDNIAFFLCLELLFSRIYRLISMVSELSQDNCFFFFVDCLCIVKWWVDKYMYMYILSYLFLLNKTDKPK
jgi:hypothetical protein